MPPPAEAELDGGFESDSVKAVFNISKWRNETMRLKDVVEKGET